MDDAIRTMSDSLFIWMEQFHMNPQHGSWSQQLCQHQSTGNNISPYTSDHSIKAPC